MAQDCGNCGIKDDQCNPAWEGQPLVFEALLGDGGFTARIDAVRPEFSEFRWIEVALLDFAVERGDGFGDQGVLVAEDAGEFAVGHLGVGGGEVGGGGHGEIRLFPGVWSDDHIYRLEKIVVLSLQHHFRGYDSSAMRKGWKAACASSKFMGGRLPGGGLLSPADQLGDCLAEGDSVCVGEDLCEFAGIVGDVTLVRILKICT